MAPLLARSLVDHGADRRLGGEPQQAAEGRYQSDIGLAPVQLGDEEDIEIRAKCTAHVGEQEVDGVEREGVEAFALG